jgi:predicted ribosomally synthesized peptide with nif11-like leader
MENAKKFYEALTKDPAMQERAKNLVGEKPANEEAALAAIVEFAAKEGYSFTADKARAYITERKAEAAKGEMSDEELANVAGGCSHTCPLSYYL